MMKKLTFLLVLSFAFCAISNAQNERSYAEEMANTAMEIYRGAIDKPQDYRLKWSYDMAVVLKGIEGVWYKTSDKKYFDYMQAYMDAFVTEDGEILTYKQHDYNIDHVLGGRILLTLFKTTKRPKYYKAALRLRGQLQDHPRTNEGGFWHKKIYPWQMWLDGLYMGQPFYAEWAGTFHEDTAFNDIARQFILMEKRSVDEETGLMYHGYDESREQLWADKTTGRSRHFWARAMGWYGMGLADALELFPENHPQRQNLIGILNRFAEAVVKVQDAKTGLWWDILNYPERDKNYFESSASSMLVYALAKGVRLGYLPEKFLANAQKGYDGILQNFIEEKSGRINLTGTVSVSGLGGKPYRDGSYEYYMSERVITNDPKGVGAFILAANEMELVPTLPVGKGKTVLLDSYFNNETRKDASGMDQSFHYQWADKSYEGFYQLGYFFNSYGVQTRTLKEAPTRKNLRGADIYIIVDPDNHKEVKSPNFIGKKDIKAVKKWVKKGGVLMMFANDSAHTELFHFNKLAGEFGIHWNDESRNWVKKNQYEQGAVVVPDGHSVFTPGTKLFLKEICLIDIKQPAKALLTEGGDVIMATSKLGKGMVFAVGDPWLYNEYTDGRKLPAEFRNDIAARDLIQWIIRQINE